MAVSGWADEQAFVVGGGSTAPAAPSSSSGRRDLPAALLPYDVGAMSLVGIIRFVCILLGVFALATAATGALVALPPPAAGGTCGPGTSSESPIAAFFDPGSIGAGAEPSAASGQRAQWKAFISDCQSATDTRMAVAGGLVIGALLLGLGVPWALRRSTRKDRSTTVGLPPPGWYPDPTNPALARWWDGRMWWSSYDHLPNHEPSAPFPQ